MIQHDIKIRVARALLTGLLAASTGACSSASLSEGGVTASELPARAAEVYCGELGSCCAAAQFRYDDAACKAAVSGEFQYDVSMVGNGLAFDSAAAKRCLDELSSATKDCNAFDKSQLPDCNHLLFGTLPVGSPCNDPRACAAPRGVIADCLSNPAVSGTCILEPSAPHAKLGEACVESCDEFGECTGNAGEPTTNAACYQTDGSYCSDALRCAPIAAMGAPCTSDEACVGGGVLCIDSTGTPLTPYVPPVGHCGVPTSNGLLASPYGCLSIPDPNQN